MGYCCRISRVRLASLRRRAGGNIKQPPRCEVPLSMVRPSSIFGSFSMEFLVAQMPVAFRTEHQHLCRTPAPLPYQYGKPTANVVRLARQSSSRSRDSRSALRRFHRGAHRLHHLLDCDREVSWARISAAESAKAALASPLVRAPHPALPTWLVVPPRPCRLKSSLAAPVPASSSSFSYRPVGTGASAPSNLANGNF